MIFVAKLGLFPLIAKFLHIFARNHFFQMLAKITPLVQLLRPKHWIKNVLLFTPLIFSGSLLKPEAILHAALGFLYFSIAASLVYTINDLADVERDRLHPVKRLKRPLASGAVSKQTAVGIIVLFSLLSPTSVFFSPAFAQHYPLGKNSYRIKPPQSSTTTIIGTSLYSTSTGDSP